MFPLLKSYIFRFSLHFWSSLCHCLCFVYLVTTGEFHVHCSGGSETDGAHGLRMPPVWKRAPDHKQVNTEGVGGGKCPEKTPQGSGQSVPGGARWRGCCVGSWGWAQCSACPLTLWPWPTSSTDLGRPCPFSSDARPRPSSFPTSVRVESGEFDLRLFLSCENSSEIKLTSALCLFSHLLSKQHNYHNLGDWAETKTPQKETSPSLRTPNSASSEMAPQAGLSTASRPGSQVASMMEGPPQTVSTHQRTPRLREEGISTSTTSRPPQASDRRHHSPSTRWPGRGGPSCLAWVFPTLNNSHPCRIPPVWVTKNCLIFHLKSPKNKHIGTLKAPSI